MRRRWLIREPGGTDAAERIRELLADPALALDPLAELLLFLAARADLTGAGHPAGAGGRARPSSPTASPTPASPTRAPPGGSAPARCSVSATPAIDGLWPDLTLLLKVEPELSLGRAGGKDRFESEGLELQRAVAEAYEEIAVIACDRVVVIDADGNGRGGSRAGDGRRLEDHGFLTAPPHEDRA